MSHTEELVKALRHVHGQLAGTAPIDGHARFLLRGSVEYALAQAAFVTDRRPRREATAGVGAIEEIPGT